MSSRPAPVKTTPMAADGVVLPMPMSPVPRMSTPSSIRAGRQFETGHHGLFRASVRVMAGPTARLAVPRPTFAHDQAFAALQVFGIQIRDDAHVDHRTSASIGRARTLMPAPPRKKVLTISPVITWG